MHYALLFLVSATEMSNTVNSNSSLLFSFLNFRVPYATTKLLLLRDMEGKINQQASFQ